MLQTHQNSTITIGEGYIYVYIYCFSQTVLWYGRDIKILRACIARIFYKYTTGPPSDRAKSFHLKYDPLEDCRLAETSQRTCPYILNHRLSPYILDRTSSTAPSTVLPQTYVLNRTSSILRPQPYVLNRMYSTVRP